MKFFVKFYIFLFTLFLFSSAAANEKSVVILDIDTNPKPKPVTLEDTVNFIVDTAKYFDSQYPGDKINQDFHDDVAKHFPGLSGQEVYDYQRYIRSGINIYRFAKKLFNQYIEARLTPEDPPLIAKDSEYDLSSPETPYIESQNDETVVIQDFKKIISYGDNPREIQAYRAKLATEGEKKGKLKDFEEIAYILSKLDFKKFFFYNIFYGSPLTGNRGIGKWDEQENIKLRLTTIQTGIVEGQKIQGVIHMMLPPNTFVTAIDNGEYFKPKISFEKSQNLKSLDFTLPLPQRLKNMDKDWSVYTEELAIPFTAEAIDSSKDLSLSADIELNFCNQSYQCHSLDFHPLLKLKPGYTRDSSVATYIRMVFDFLRPLPQSELQITSLNLEKTSDGQSMLTAVLNTPVDIESFSIFISNSAQITFERPRIHIDGKKIIVRWLTDEVFQNLENTSFEITAEVNQKYILRQNLTPISQKTQISTASAPLITIILTAFLCGILLNFMPPVLSLWLLKFSSLSGFGFQKNASVVTNLKFTFAGVCLAFLCVSIFITAAPFLEITFYAGDQFQNSWFVIFIIFGILLMIAHTLKLFELTIFEPLLASSNRKLYFISGVLSVIAVLIVWLPIFDDIIGITVHDAPWKAVLILVSLFIGFTIPYWFIFSFPAFISVIPTPGPWMQKLNYFTRFTLLVSLLWMLFIVYSFLGSGFSLRLLFLYIIFFFICLWLRHIALNYSYENLPLEIRKVAAHKLANFFTLCAVCIVIVSAVDASLTDHNHRQDLISSHPITIDEQSIEDLIKQGKTVLVTVEADWNPICRYNQWVVFNNPTLIKTLKYNNVHMFKSNWLTSSELTEKFLKKFNQYSLPVYILFSPMVPDGLILPKILNAQNMSLLIDNLSVSSTRSEPEVKPNS